MISLAILGCGNMGRAFAEGLLNGNVVMKESLLLIERRKERRESLVSELGCRCEEQLVSLRDARYLLLAVKPQDLAEAAAQIRPLLNDSVILISLLAGMPIEMLRTACGGHKRIVRAMPNLPAIIGAGVSGYICQGEYTVVEKGEIYTIFRAVGEVVELQDESLMNAVTAISGSGPAYVYYLIDAWTRAATQMGFSPEQARILIRQTLVGACQLWEQQSYDQKTLQARVTSKGGTTEAAIRHMHDQGLDTIFIAALEKARERGVELELLVREKV